VLNITHTLFIFAVQNERLSTVEHHDDPTLAPYILKMYGAKGITSIIQNKVINIFSYSVIIKALIL